jgi:hypothetical protein
MSTAASTNSPKNNREPTETSLLSDFTSRSLCRWKRSQILRQHAMRTNRSRQFVHVTFRHGHNYPYLPG